MENSIFDPITGKLNRVTEEEHKSTVDYILQDVMKNKKPTKIQKEFILLGYPKDLIFLIGDEGGGDVFKVIKNNGKTITLEPLGTNSLSYEKMDLEKKTISETKIHKGKIVTSTAPL